jgi:hypothetical protein
MTAKEFVKDRFPNAKAEKHIEGMIMGLIKPYYLIRGGRSYMYLSSGKTASNAWVKAKEHIINQEKNK